MKLSNLVLVLPLCGAFDSPRLIFEKIDEDRTFAEASSADLIADFSDVAERKLEICTSCVSADQISEEVEQGRRPIRDVIGRIQKLLRGNLASSLTTAFETATGQEISVETLIPILISAGGQFSDIVQGIQGSQNNTIAADSSTELSDQIFELIESIGTAFSSLLTTIVDIFVSLGQAFVNTVAAAILSIFSIIENVLLSIIEIIINFLEALSGGARADSSRLKGVVSQEKVANVFGEVIAALTDVGDGSGLPEALEESAADMNKIGFKLDKFVDRTEASLQQSEDVAVSEDTAVEIADLIVEIISTSTNLVVSLITNFLDVFVGLFSFAIDFFLNLISGILNLIVAILESILNIFNVSSGTMSEKTAEDVGILSGMLSSRTDIVMVASCALGGSCKSDDLYKCKLEQLSCQNAML